MCRFPYMPRLKAESVLTATVQAGVASRDFFGLAQGKEADRYLGFSFNADALASMYTDTLLIVPETAAAYQAKLDEEKRIREALPEGGNTDKHGHTGETDTTPSGTDLPKVQKKKRFYASVELESLGTKTRFSDIADNIIKHLTDRPDTRVTITIDIHAATDSCFDEDIQRVLKENCNTLKFKNVEFEE
jgi:hypothetical protein